MKLTEKQQQLFEKKMLLKGQTPDTLSGLSGVSAPAIRRLLGGDSISRSTFIKVAGVLEKQRDAIDPELLAS